MAKKAVINKKKIKEETKTEQPSVIFMGEKANKSVGLIYLGVIAVILGFLSPYIPKTIFSTSADFIVSMGLVAIVVGLIINNRKKILALFSSNKKNQ